MREVILACGSKTQVSDEDYSFLNNFNWSSLESTNTLYAARGIRVNGYYSKIMMHRVIAKRMDCKIDGLEIDHKDRDGLNNQRNNLEVVTKAVNQQRAIERTDNTSGKKGVNYSEKQRKWIARISISGQRILLGAFETLEQAVAVRLAAEKRYKIHG